MRLFVALDLPEPIKAQIAALQERSLRGARWTKAAQWHVTLHFIGETEQRSQIEEVLQTVQAAAFEMRLRGVGTFPPKGKPRVLWAGIEAPPALQALHRSAGDALKTTGYTPETRPYKPHLTLARFKHEAPSAQDMRRYVERQERFATESFPVEHFTLYESRLQPSGAKYLPIAKFSLASRKNL